MILNIIQIYILGTQIIEIIIFKSKDILFQHFAQIIKQSVLNSPAGSSKKDCDVHTKDKGYWVPGAAFSFLTTGFFGALRGPTSSIGSYPSLTLIDRSPLNRSAFRFTSF